MAKASGKKSGSKKAAVDGIQQVDSLGFYPMLTISLVLGIAFPCAIWLMIKEPQPTPLQQTEDAIELLEAGRTKTAYLQAMKLLKAQVSDPGIGGSLEFIVGVAHFRKAEKDVKESPIMNRNIAAQGFELARRYLEQANLKTIKTELQSEWSYSLGACYYYLGRLYDAREKLEFAYAQSEKRRAHTMLMLGKCYVDSNVMKASLIHQTNLLEEQTKRREIIARLEKIVDPHIQNQPLTDAEIVEAYMYIAELYRQDKKLDQAEQAMQKIRDHLKNHAFPEDVKVSLADSEELLRAMIILDRGDAKKARDIVQSLIAEKSGLELKTILQGHYIIGLTFSREEKIDLAIDHLEKAALVTDSEVCFPANLYAGELARRRGLHEDALVYYLRALSLVDSTESFTNRWIDLNKARLIIKAAWDDWGTSQRYEHYRFSMDLADHMVPLFAPEFANQLSAMANRKRAEIIQKEMEREGKQSDPEMRLLVSDHWKRAGNAYARLASSSQSSDKYAETLWEASQLYRKGSDHKNALLMIKKYIATNPRTGLPQALIMKARTLMDLDPFSEKDRTAEAIEILEDLIKKYPKDQSIYDAQLLLGQAYLEEDQADRAIEIWHSLVTESPLTPRATEWQSAMFALGQVLFNTSDTRPYILLKNKLEADENETDVEKSERPEHFQHVDDAIRWLDEFVRRIPDHPRSQEARWLLAKGLRYRASKPAEQLENKKVATTENTRNELLKEIRSLLERSKLQFRILRDQLAAQEERNQLDELTRQFVRDAYFEPAHIQYDLGPYDTSGDAYRKAIDDYSNAAFHFSGDPAVLIAYFRIAECYRQLGAEAEARRQLEQARVILSQIEEPFSQSSTNFNKQQWEQLLLQYVKLYDLALDQQVVQ